MPNYEYGCKACKKKFSTYMSYEEYGKKPVNCPYCGSDHVQRRIGRVRVTTNLESRLEDIDDPRTLEGLEDDPRALGRMMRKMSKEVGEDMGPEFDEVINRLEAGQHPDQIEKELPDLGMDGGPGGSLGGDDFDE
jgi:putative FmdB family regulatory protein